MSEADRNTLSLLQRWHTGDEEALSQLVERNFEWIRAHVHKRLGPELRAKAQTGDFVQEAMLDLLRNGPKFLISSNAHFRGLLARIVENVICDKKAWFSARRRQANKERQLPADSVLALDPVARSVARPSQVAQKHEDEAWIRLGLELLRPEERRVVVLRLWDRMPFAAIGEELATSEDAARMRHSRALARLSVVLAGLKSGQYDPLDPSED